MHPTMHTTMHPTSTSQCTCPNFFHSYHTSFERNSTKYSTQVIINSNTNQIIAFSHTTTMHPTCTQQCTPQCTCPNFFHSYHTSFERNSFIKCWEMALIMSHGLPFTAVTWPCAWHVTTMPLTCDHHAFDMWPCLWHVTMHLTCDHL